jgi:transposase
MKYANTRLCSCASGTAAIGSLQRIHDGWARADVAKFLGVHPRTLRRWLTCHRGDPEHGLDAKPHPGPQPKLTVEQDAVVLSWFSQSATAFGFATDLWTAGRVAILIERFFAVRFNSHYLSAWLARRRITSQKPECQPRERDQAKIDDWLQGDWPRIKKKPARKRRHSF